MNYEMNIKSWISIIVSIIVSLASIAYAYIQTKTKDLILDDFQIHLTAINTTASATHSAISEIHKEILKLEDEDDTMDFQMAKEKIGNAIGFIRSLRFSCDSILYYRYATKTGHLKELIDKGLFIEEKKKVNKSEVKK